MHGILVMKIDNRIVNLFKILFDHEAIIVVVKGYWKTGKTNTALFILEVLKEIGIIELGATNIKIQETEHFKFIEDMESLKRFHYDDPIKPKSKAFIFDEAGKLALRRRAMNKTNVNWMRFIPELSKGKMKLFIITQSEFLTDSMFVNTSFTKVVIETFKHDRYGYSIAIESQLLEKKYNTGYLRLNKFPKTSIKYSPYESAEWFDEKATSDNSRLLCCDVAHDYAVKNMSMSKIADARGWTTRTITLRLIKRHIRHTLNMSNSEDIIEVARELKENDIQKQDTESELSEPVKNL